jgi:hypothetical protein
MSVHIDVLSRLHLLWGAFGVLSGSSLFILALGTHAAAGELGQAGPGAQAAVGVLIVIGLVLGVGGALSIGVGLSLGRRRPFARLAALLFAVPNLLLAPFGTALGIYSWWVLLNDDARRTFSRGGGEPPHLVGVERS